MNTSVRAGLDPSVRALLDEEHRAATGSPPPADDAARVAAVRKMLSAMAGIRGSIPGLPNAVSSVDRVAGMIPVRVYSPPDVMLAPSLVYLHGGGWLAGSIETHDPFCRLLAERARVHIVSVEYRRAPEHPFPSALEDAESALRWTAEHAHEWGGDAARVALGGDSAGANLAAVTTNRLAHRATIAASLLLYPVTDHPSAEHASYTENGFGYGLEAPIMRWFWQQYAPNADPNDSDLSPLRIPVDPNLPPTLIATAEYDVLRDEGIAYATRLAAAGINVHHLHASDMPHNFPVFPDMVARFPQSVDTLDAIASWLRETLSASRKG